MCVQDLLGLSSLSNLHSRRKADVGIVVFGMSRSIRLALSFPFIEFKDHVQQFSLVRILPVLGIRHSLDIQALGSFYVHTQHIAM